MGKVNGCNVESLLTADGEYRRWPVGHQHGSCGTFNFDGQEKILVCHSYHDPYNRCRT